jgi:uncharacterized repeat protein (TIGR03803 family)
VRAWQNDSGRELEFNLFRAVEAGGLCWRAFLSVGLKKVDLPAGLSNYLFHSSTFRKCLVIGVQAGAYMSDFLFYKNLRLVPVAGTRAIWLNCILTACLITTANRVWGQNDFVRLTSFGNPALSAATPWSMPIVASDGALYGTTSEGGGTNDFGTIFRVNPDGSGLMLLHRFTGSPGDGQSPEGGLIEGNDGALYGTTYLGGSNNLGTIFRITKDGTTYSILRHLATADGTKPQGSLFAGTDGALYGTTSSTVFKVGTDGSGFTVLHSFGTQSPQFGVIEASDGFLYGTTSAGGANNLGTVFQLTTDGSSYALLHSFDGTNGRSPQAGLLEASNGMLYGTTSFRATNSYGAIFQLDKAGANFNVLHTFTGTNADGWYPQSALIQGNDTVLYGTTTNGGMEGQGTIFKLNQDGGGYGVVHHFSWSGGDGRVPLAGLFKGTNGTFYGTTALGGRADYGSVFNFDPATSNCMVVASFSWTGNDGWNPLANVIEASDGRLYGTTFNGGSNDFGTVFGMNKDRSGFTVLHHFSGVNGDGSHPQAALLQGSDGALYGTTAQGGSNNYGTVFTLNPDGTGFAVLHNVPGTNTAEFEPVASLIEGSDGNLYGVAAGIFTTGAQYTGAPTNRAGSVFMLNKDGSTFMDLHSFTNSTTEGQGLGASLVEGTNGALYGTTYAGGTKGYGVVFTVNKDGSGFNVLWSFTNLIGNPNAFGGLNPAAGLIKDSNGVLYGTTFNGYTNINSRITNRGTVFKLGEDGSNFMTLHGFSSITAGQNPVAGLTLASDGAFYGTATAGGDMGAGVIFSLANPPVFTGLQFGSSGALLQFQGAASGTYAIQTTTNLAPAFWQTLPGSATGTNGLFQFFDSTASNAPAKYYRTVTPPPVTTNIAADVVVYGATSGGVMSAIQLERMGNNVALVTADSVIGGMTVSGLSAADTGGATNYMRGIVREFYARVATYYNTNATFPAYFYGEPHINQQVMWDMINASGTNGGTLTIYSNQPIVSVAKNGSSITSLTTTITNFTAKVFIDCSYEGDLMASAGVTYTIGREGTNAWNETNAGIQTASAIATVSPYVNYTSGTVVPLITDTNSVGLVGSSDGSIQAYCYRLCLTKVVSNMVAFTAPTNYSAANYTMLSRAITNMSEGSLSQVLQIQPIANGKLDGNGAVAANVTIDYVGQSGRYLTNTFAGRQAWAAELKGYIQGLLYFLANDLSVNSGMRADTSSYGYCADEFLSTSNFPTQVYVREGRHMVSDYTITHSNVCAALLAPHSVGLAVYQEDSHQCNRYWTATPSVVNEGNIVNYYQPALSGWAVEYQAIIPKTNDCSNLFVTYDISATHLSFGSYRMEPVFMIVSQSAAIAAHICIQSNWTVQQLTGNYPVLSNQLATAGEKLY